MSLLVEVANGTCYFFDSEPYSSATIFRSYAYCDLALLFKEDSIMKSARLALLAWSLDRSC